jgi:uncharacterized membrane protein SpoIIM required for sporulation
MKAPTISSWFGRGQVEASPDIESAALRSDRFRLEREGEWRRLDRILERMEKGGLRRIADDDLVALPALYRTAASSLSVARETSLDAATLAYLEALVQRAWFQVYGPRQGFWRWLRGFIFGGWGRAVRELWLDMCIALFVMVAGTVVGWLLVAQDEAWFYRLFPASIGDARSPGASREQLLEVLGHDQGAAGLAGFAAQLFSNNSAVCILSFALGFAFGIPSLMLLVHNTALLGVLLWLYDGQNLLVELAAWLSVHGTTELFGILLSGAAGLHIGRAMAFPGKLAVLEAAAAAGRRCAVVMVGVVIMMVVAAFLEAFPRQLVEDTFSRYLIGGTMLVFWLSYFFLYRPAPRPGEDAA